MKLVFQGICTHVINQIQSPVKHYVLLPAAKGYTVRQPDGTKLSIPDHTPYLSIEAADVVSGDLAAFGRSLKEISGTGPLRWDLGRSRVRFAGITTPLVYPDPRMRKLPHLNSKVVTVLDPAIRGRKHPQSVAGIVEVTAGSIDGEVGRGGARHVQVTSQQDTPWQIQIDDEPPLTIAAGATVVIGNDDTVSEVPCDKYDYLLHYRLTNKKWVDPSDYEVPGSVPLEGDSTTLTNCSNSVYP